MLILHLIQADYGDCLLIEFGEEKDTKYLLVDGGPSETYENNLMNVLSKLDQKGRKLDLVVSTHVDDDHIEGLLKLFGGINYNRIIRERQKKKGEESDVKDLIQVEKLWFNSFAESISYSEEEILDAKETVQIIKTTLNPEMFDESTKAIAEGDTLRGYADALGIPINPEFNFQPISKENATNHPIIVDGLDIYIIGPTKDTLVKLKTQWDEFICKYLADAKDKAIDLRGLRAADTRIPNMSSIIILIESNEKRILLTGDGVSQDIMTGLDKHNFLDSNGKLHVDILLAPHHGSRRNVTKKFFENITANKYVISAGFKHKHPSKQTLEMIIDSIDKEKGIVEIYLTNITPNVEEFLSEFPEKEHGYVIKPIKNGEFSIPVVLVE